MIELYGFKWSTNVERVTLALAHKKLKVKSVEIDPRDRSEVRRISGQDLVPVLVDGKKVVSDSMEIVRYLEEQYPDYPLYPKNPARRSEMLIFIDWFNRVWKRPPNDIEAEMGRPIPDTARIRRLGKAITDSLDLFEGMLVGRDYLMGEFSAADCAAFPFLRYGLIHDPKDTYLFHNILVQYETLGPQHRRLADWIRHINSGTHA